MPSIIFYGAGRNAHDNFDRWHGAGLRPACFADKNVNLHHTVFKDSLEILPLLEAVAKYPDYELYCTQARQSLPEVTEYLLGIGVPREKIKFCEPSPLKKSFTAMNLAINEVLEDFLQSEREKCDVDERCAVSLFHPHILNEGGNITVYHCSPVDLIVPDGDSLTGKAFEKVWNSQTMEVRRSKIRRGDFSNCSLLTCATKGRYLAFYDYFEHTRRSTGKNPLVIKFMHDCECNYHCVMCRKKVMGQRELEELNKKIETVFLPMCESADAVYLAGYGDPFASRHYRELMKAIALRYTQMKFILHTNGSLMTEENCAKIGIENRIDSVMLSINAACKATYEKISPGASWERILKNLEYIDHCRKNGTIRALFFSLIVQKENYSEMPYFVEFARRWRAKCRFSLCHPEPLMGLDYDKTCVFDSRHPEFSAYRKILDSPVFDWSGCYLDPYSKWLRECNGTVQP